MFTLKSIQLLRNRLLRKSIVVFDFQFKSLHKLYEISYLMVELNFN